jgi:hypothetical protein
MRILNFIREKGNSLSSLRIRERDSQSVGWYSHWVAVVHREQGWVHGLEFAPCKRGVPLETVRRQPFLKAFPSLPNPQQLRRAPPARLHPELRFRHRGILQAVGSLLLALTRLEGREPCPRLTCLSACMVSIIVVSVG